MTASPVPRVGRSAPVLSVLPDVAGQGIDPPAARAAVTDLLAALGQDVDDPELRETPRRVVAALTEMLSPVAFDLTTFPNDDHYDELVLVRDIPVRSMCAHHLLPFVGVAHVAYLPAERILGLSKLARVVDLYARRPSVQERLTAQVADALVDRLKPRGVIVVVEAEHLCMTVRGVR